MTTPAGELPAGVAAAPPGPGDGPQYFSHRQILVILVGVMAGMLLFALDQGIVGTALPRIVSELGGLDKLSWVVTAYLLTSTATTPLWGKISDLYGPGGPGAAGSVTDGEVPAQASGAPSGRPSDGREART